MVIKQRNPTGENSYNAKLTESQVMEIFNSPLSLSQLAKIYKVNFRHISKIKNGKAWKHLKLVGV